MRERSWNPRVFRSKRPATKKPRTIFSTPNGVSEDSEEEKRQTAEENRKAVEIIETVTSLMAEICEKFDIPNACVCRIIFGRKLRISVIIPNVSELSSSLAIRSKTTGVPEKIKKLVIEPLAALAA